MLFKRFNIVVFFIGNEEVLGQKGCFRGFEIEGFIYRNKG